MKLLYKKHEYIIEDEKLFNVISILENNKDKDIKDINKKRLGRYLKKYRLYDDMFLSYMCNSKTKRRV